MENLNQYFKGGIQYEKHDSKGDMGYNGIYMDYRISNGSANILCKSIYDADYGACCQRNVFHKRKHGR